MMGVALLVLAVDLNPYVDRSFQWLQPVFDQEITPGLYLICEKFFKNFPVYDAQRWMNSIRILTPSRKRNPEWSMWV